MHGELLMLFVILLLGLILCSFLGGAGCREGMENASYTGPNGSTAQVQDDTKTLVITNSDGTTATYSPSILSSNTYTGPNEGTALITTGSDGKNVLKITQKDGTVHTYTLSVISSTPSSTSPSSTSPSSTSPSSTTPSSTTPSSTPSSTTPSSTTTPSTTDYDNYDHYSGSSMPSIFYGPNGNGGTAKVINTPDNNSIVITNKNGTTEIYRIQNNTSGAKVTTYYGPNGGSAKIIITRNLKKAVQITNPNGSKIVYTEDNDPAYNSQDDTINQYSADTNTTGSDYNSAFSATSYTGPNVKATTVSGPSGNTYSTYDSSAYYNSLPQGISKNQITPGDEDLYILKSQVVPPVCPRCPDPIIQTSNSSSGNGSSDNGSSGNSDNTKCPPCPACARCPEPAFDCVKRPNYNAFNPSYMPMPVVSDFSTFGM
jgi:hypothetical protein